MRQWCLAAAVVCSSGVRSIKPSPHIGNLVSRFRGHCHTRAHGVWGADVDHDARNHHCADGDGHRHADYPTNRHADYPTNRNGGANAHTNATAHSYSRSYRHTPAGSYSYPGTDAYAHA